MKCRVCDDIQEILVRRHPSGLKPLMCPACYGVLPKEEHARPETYEDAIAACESAGVAPALLTAPLSQWQIDLRDVGESFDGVERASWEVLGARNPDAPSSAMTCSVVRVTTNGADASEAWERIESRERCGAPVAWLADVPKDASAYRVEICSACFKTYAGKDITCEPEPGGLRVGIAGPVAWKPVVMADVQTGMGSKP